MEVFDVVIIGSGLGGLECAYILSKEGYKVCVLEKNRQLGGSLQIFVRDKAIFDTGVHYIGGLDDGQNLNQSFKYFGIMDKLKLQKMDENGFDRISFRGDDTEYKHAQGHENFVEQLSSQFPEERAAIEKYIEDMHEVCNYFPLYQLRLQEMPKIGLKYLDVNAKDYIDSLTSNITLQNVLAGTNPLYAGVADRTPIYVHSLIMNSYIESSYKCIDGGAQIEKLLTANIKAQGCVVRNYAEVETFVETNGRIEYVELKSGERIYGKDFISNIHPSLTLDKLVSSKIKKAYRKRIKGLQNSSSVFIVDVVLKPETFKYLNYNTYYYSNKDVWRGVDVKGEEWPDGFCMFVPKSSRTGEYANCLSVLAYMDIEEVSQWSDTFATIPKDNDSRGDDYEDFKEERAERLLKMVYEKFPELKNCIQSYTCGTPLTYRDYIGTENGGIYGISKDYKDAIRTFISPNTKVPNLFFTGQNLNMHGILGVTVSAIRTTSHFLGTEYLINKINKA